MRISQIQRQPNSMFNYWTYLTDIQKASLFLKVDSELLNAMSPPSTD